jgi:uncharacterized membrane protein
MLNVLKRKEVNKSKKFKNKDEEIAHHKKRTSTYRFILIALIIIIAITILSFDFISITFDKEIKKDNIIYQIYNITNSSTPINNSSVCSSESDMGSEISNHITDFFNRLFEMPISTLAKILMFLGMIYLLMIIGSLIGDMLELIFVVIAFIKRLFKKDKSRKVLDALELGNNNLYKSKNI